MPSVVCACRAVDGFNVVRLKPGMVTELLLTDSAGQQLRTFADKEGWFTVPDVAPGSYVLTTYNPMFVYPEVRSRKRTVAVRAGLVSAQACQSEQHTQHVACSAYQQATGSCSLDAAHAQWLWQMGDDSAAQYRVLVVSGKCALKHSCQGRPHSRQMQPNTCQCMMGVPAFLVQQPHMLHAASVSPLRVCVCLLKALAVHALWCYPGVR